MPPRYVFFGFFFILGAGITAAAYLPDFGWPLNVALGSGVPLVAVLAAVVLFRLGRRGGAGR